MSIADSIVQDASPSVLDFVRDYCERGYRVLPTDSVSKRPLLEGWPKNATADFEAARVWFANPRASVGIAAGADSDLLVIDADQKSGGLESLAELEARFPELSQTARVRTGGGGVHLYLRHLPGLRNSAGDIAPGIDIRTEAGYVVAPPSLHKSGNRYEWINDGAVLDASKELADLLYERTGQNSRRVVHSAGDVTEAPIPQGSRNASLASIGGTLRALGFQGEKLNDVLQVVNAEGCDTPLPEKEVELVARSLSKYDATRVFALTDEGNAQRFAAAFGDDIRWCQSRRKWLQWDGRRWAEDNAQRALGLARLLGRLIRMEAKLSDSEQRRTDLLKWARASEKKSAIESALRLAQSDLFIDQNALDKQPSLFNVANGTIDLNTGQLLAHDKAHLLTQCSPVAFDPSAECPTWINFVDQVTGGDAELANYLQKVVGYAMFGTTQEQVVFFFYGTGANGKSTFLETISDLFGDYGSKSSRRTFAAKHLGHIPNDLARLAGKRLVTIAEMDSEERIDEVLIKEMTGGDRIAARFLYGEYFEYVPEMTCIVSMNSLPEVRGADDGIWRRMRVVPFLVTFAPNQRDRNLLVKLRGELPGILNWCLAGVQRWRAEGLTPTPKAVNHATNRYRAEMDAVGTFLKDCVYEDKETFTPFKDVYTAFNKWAEEAGVKSMSRDAFSRRMSEHRHQTVPKRIGGQSTKGYPGIALYI